MRKIFILAILSGVVVISFSQTKSIPLNANAIQRPKLVVGIVVDQMRWDFLYRYYERYAVTGGFKRFLTQGYSCENTLIPYTPTVTACGHTTIYTGSVPSIHGVTGNAWYDNLLKRTVYCTEDNTVKAVGATGAVGEMSPRNMLVTTICDELRLASNFGSKVIGVAFKDRGGILPAGHSANAAYWYNGSTGDWITSTYYMNELPAWVKDFNAKKLSDKYYKQNWKTLYPIGTYLQSTTDEKGYEVKSLGADAKGFPYDLEKFVGKNYGAIASTPYGNSITAEMAKAAIEAERLGADNVTDILAVSFSSPDYVGHAFGPNSIEIEDTYLRLDKDLGDFFTYLDTKIGKGEYLVFLSADHGVSHIPDFLKENRIPAGTINSGEIMSRFNIQLKEKFGKDRLIVSMFNYQVHLNHPVIDSSTLNENAIKKWIIDSLKGIESVVQAIDLQQLGNIPLNVTIKTMIENGYFPRRCGDIQIIFRPQFIDGGFTGTTHGSWNPYDAHIPLLWYGWNILPGKTHRETYMTDIAPTLAAILKIQAPSGSVGKVIEEVVR
ncbi:MAG: alkaline phosphatase family protein [Chitinophagaceae bacterium]|nr:alkaline phosphatase family protein [Chitinophagaceae bacterium]